MGPKKLEAIRAKVKELISDADILKGWIKDPNLVANARSKYEHWYVAALRLVRAILDEEEVERFVRAYDDFYGTQQYLTGPTPLDSVNTFAAMLARQKGLVAAIPDVIEAKALDLRILVVGDVLGGEMEKARLLLEQGLVREAGVIGGIALEGHLKLLHGVSSLEYSPADSMVDLVKRLRKEGVLTVGDQKKVTAMAVTRNKCAHKADQEPTFEEVEDLLDDVERFMKRTQVS